MAKQNDAIQATPVRPSPSTLKENSMSSQSSKQRTIQSFFAKTPINNTPTPKSGITNASGTSAAVNGIAKSPELIKKPAFRKKNVKLATPVPSSDNIGPSSSQENRSENTPVKDAKYNALTLGSSPSRTAKKVVSYAESESDSEEDAFEPARISIKKRSARRQKVEDDEDDDDYFVSGMAGAIEDDEDMDDFVVEDDSDTPVKLSRKRKLPTSAVTARKRSNIAPPKPHDDGDYDALENLEIPETSTAQQWKYDPDNTELVYPKSANIPKQSLLNKKKIKEKACSSEPEKRYPWLAQLRDMDENPIGHPEYDPRTVFIPQYAWNKFSAFEKQYWEIKQKLWDTVVFFKKGKFYELYENDATIGHQYFDLKLTDRVNMRMVGVPESSLDHWANQFVAKGFKIARVDQCESALGKEMREAEGGQKTKKPADKIIKRELSCVLTGGTLVDGSMLQDDMATFCVAIKEGIINEMPAFGIAFVDTATGQFFLSEFVDDTELTKFETFVAQIRPQELLLEKRSISSKALRILKNSTNPTTIWNHMKKNTEFWSAETTRRELDNSDYFVTDESNGYEDWPEKLREIRDKDLVMCAMGALVQYLRTLKLERNLLTQRNFSSYHPIQNGNTLVLDGQTLINLEVFANTFDGTTDGTLFTTLNRCVTPFGKRMFRQWVCHPLADAAKINERLDAVDMLNKDRTISDQFIASMTRMPDLERLISRIHAGSCKADDFVKALDGFGQVEYTMSLLKAFEGGDGIVDRLIASMPDIKQPLKWWKTAFDHSKAREHKILVPEPGVEEVFDASQDRISEIKEELTALLVKKRKEFGDSASHIQYKNIGKEVYQMEVPASIKVPKDWQMMSSAGKFKRYYFTELKQLIRQLQEAQETHSQIVKQVAGRFYTHFDRDYDVWLQAVKIVAQLDCLISLATASAALGEPSCRPQFVDADRTVVDFEELRHPCTLPSVTDFIPNDVKLGGDAANITLLTGANAAGKSTILRMTCIAVIMAQIGCYVPAISAILTPIDRIMSRLGANDNIFAAQSTFFVELSETKKILSEATPRSLVILDELGRGTSSYDGVAVAQSVLHHVATHIGCVGFFATHYHSLAFEFAGHPEIASKRMQILVDEDNRRVTFLYKLEAGVAEGSFGMHCAAMCGIPSKVIDRAEVAAKEWEHTSRLKESLDKAMSGCYIPLGLQSDLSWLLKASASSDVKDRALKVLMKSIDCL